MNLETIDRLGRAISLAKIIEMAAEGLHLEIEARGALSSAAGDLVDELKAIEDAAQVDEEPLHETSEAELAKSFDDEFELFDFSLETSIRAQLQAWRIVAELRGAVIASPSSDGRAHALDIIERLDRWFEGQDERYSAMIKLARRGAKS